MEEIQKVLVVGAGVMGHGIAQVFAQHCLNVILVDRKEALLQRAREWIRENLRFMVELDEIKDHQVKPILHRIRFQTDMHSAAKEADYVLEAITEDLDLKKPLFQQLGAVCSGNVILASNTSSFDIGEFSRVTRHPERVIGTHWFHPPPITPCVEVIPAESTSQSTIDQTLAFLERMGKYPTVCKNAPGFVANRIQFAMVAEALAIVEEGLASPKEVDRIVRSSFGFRLSAYGPFEIADQAGLDTYRSIFQYLYDKLKKEQFRPSPLLDRLVDQGKLGLKNEKGFYEYRSEEVQETKKQRDRKLYRRLRLFRDERIKERRSFNE
ncbi:MAG: 3-hydroxyacyl-CoA dehydrogenase family protein [Deltaproteobacteria bacterium]|nr:3-hydroxyacyl-CoA dehydrogenase family protein [Deltaproteobacteria bacterium]